MENTSPFLYATYNIFARCLKHRVEQQLEDEAQNGQDGLRKNHTTQTIYYIRRRMDILNVF